MGLNALSWSRAKQSPFSFVSFYRTFGGVAKDVVHHGGLVFTLVLASIGVLYLPWLIDLMKLQETAGKIYSSAPQMYLVMLTTTAYLVGLVLSSEEGENNTYSLLDALPARAVRHFLYKVTAGAILILAWLIVAGLVMGVLSGNGISLITGLFTHSPQIITVINFGQSGLITLLQICSVFMTGLLMGLLFSTLSAAAVVGLFAYAMLLFGVSRFLEDRAGLIEVVSAGALIGWMVVCSLAYSPAVAYNRRRNRSAGAEAEAVSTDVSKGMYLHLAGLAFDPPNRHLVRFPTLLALATLIPALFVLVKFDEGIMVIALYPVGAALLGACAWNGQERDAARFLTFALPVHRSQLFWPRVGALSVASLVVGIAIMLAFTFAVFFDQPADRRGHILIDGLHPAALAVGFGTVVTALLGALFRLFFRSMLIAAVLGALVIVCWGPIAVIGMDQVAIWSGKNWGIDTIAHGIWCALVSLGLPIGCMWVAFCRTRLLELPDARRGRLAMALFLLLVVWGSFLLATPPTHVFAMIFG